MTWITEKDVIVRTRPVVSFGHFDTIEEVDAKVEELWGPISRCEEEGSIPWLQVFHCQDGKHHPQGFDLVIVEIANYGVCEGAE
jgi:hypothetical protein